jgi:S-adenosylmethionine/arginine decarboxylase-like enzyme
MRKLNSPIEHHHLLLRLETTRCPDPKEAFALKQIVEATVRDIQMKPLDEVRIYAVLEPVQNKGVTGIVPIETSHIAFHFWSSPEKNVLHSSKSRCLLQFDLYTCGSLTQEQIARVLHHLTQYGPTAAEITLLNRKRGLAIEKHTRWCIEEQGPWSRWLRRFRGSSTRRVRPA